MRFKIDGGAIEGRHTLAKSDTVGEGRLIRASNSLQQGYKAGAAGDEEKGGRDRDSRGVGQRKSTEGVFGGADRQECERR